MESEEVRDDGERKERYIEQDWEQQARRLGQEAGEGEELGDGRGCRTGAGQEQGDDALLGARGCWGGDDTEQQAGKGVFPYSELSVSAVQLAWHGAHAEITADELKP